MAEVDPTQQAPGGLSPYTIRATSRKFKQLYDRDGGAWHALWKKLSERVIESSGEESDEERCVLIVRMRARTRRREAGSHVLAASALVESDVAND